ncbi:GNAT family N-acetyltransferase [Domibacillus indicus]|uniref:GNAT family N-acetyltransferase n=1 Tax=Domibacillus indicus TaxID=1437523 RepID=UPI000617F984|nr:GNAT family N-acetyltransferase [Domibacillus indicus]
MEWSKDEFMISDESSLMNLDIVSYLLSSTYWASKRTKEAIEASIQNSISFGVYHNNRQIGFARAVTDRAVFSWILDVVIDERYREKGIGQWLMKCMLEHPDMKHTKFALATTDAHEFYKKFNFKETQCMIRV